MNYILKQLRRIAPATMVLVALAFGMAPMVAEAAVPNYFQYQGRLLTAPTTPAANTTYQMRFSLWSDADFEASDIDGSGDLVAAPWQEVQTITTDSQGFFIANVGSVTALPNFVSGTHEFIQAEVKADGAANTTYFLLDNMQANAAIDRKSIINSVYAQNAKQLDGRELGFGNGDIPFLDPVTGKLDRTLITDDSWLDPVADEAALPVSGNQGDIVYVQSTDRIYTYNGTAWIKTGGAVDGSISGLEGRMTTAEADIDANTAAISAETTRATTAEGVNATAIATEQARAEAAELVLTNDLATEQARAEAAELVLTNDLATEAARAAAAELVLTNDLSTEAARAIAAELVLTNNLAAEAARAAAAEAANAGNITTLNADVNTAGSVLKSIKDNGQNATFSSTTGIAATTLGTAIDEVNENISDAINGLSWKAPVADVAALTTTYTSPVVGDTAYVTSIGEIYTWNGTSWVKTGADFFQDGSETAKGIVQFATDGETSALRAVQGNDSRLAQVGVNTTNITTNAANIATNVTDISTNATAISTEQTRAEAAEATLTTNLATEAARATAAETANATAISTEAARATAAEGVNATAIATETSRATTAEGVNAAAIATETSRATAVEDNTKNFVSTGFDVFIVNF